MIAKFRFTDLEVVFRDIGLILRYSAILFAVPLLLSLLFGEIPENAFYYGISGVAAFLAGTALLNIFTTEKETTFKHALLITALAWLLFNAVAAMPFMWIAKMPFLDSYFEAMSALTTTGLSLMDSTGGNVFTPIIDTVPASLILWRSILSWIGGIGIVVLAMVGVFSSYGNASKMIIAEGRDERLKPNLKNSMKEVWGIYAGLTVIGIVLLFLSGMTPLDAVNYSMSAISTTGMATTSQGLNAPNMFWLNEGIRNYWVDIVLVLIMVLGATSFYTHFLAKKGNYKAYTKDPQFMWMVALGIIGGLFIIPKLGLESGFFHAFSALTCGGFELATGAMIESWDEFVKLILIIGMFIGGSAGSTAGGIKMNRFILFVKGAFWRIKESLLPKGSFFPKKFEGHPVTVNELKEINLFLLLYIVFIVAGILVLTYNGATISDASFEVVSAQGNAGISSGITNVGMPQASMFMLIINMWVGRLEIIPIFSLLGLIFHLRDRAVKANE